MNIIKINRDKNGRFTFGIFEKPETKFYHVVMLVELMHPRRKKNRKILKQGKFVSIQTIKIIKLNINGL